MADEGFKLPGSSLAEVEKVLEAYAQKSGPATNEELGKITGMAQTDVSRNNGFLSSVGLIEGGRHKGASELGRKLGRALHHQQADEIKQYWQKTVASNPFMSEQLTAVRIQKGIDEEEFPGKILYNAGATKTKNSEAGARAVADILVKAGLLTVKDGKYIIATAPTSGPDTEAEGSAATAAPAVADAPPADTPRSPAAAVAAGQGQGFSLAVNLQLQLPEFEDPSKYEDLFKALRKYLLPQADG
jgi:hypothetical protein